MRNQKNREAVLLINLGSPASPAVPDVRRYLAQFLMDGHVIDAPKVIRWIIVYLFILPFRPKRSAEAYRKIWMVRSGGGPGETHGSPQATSGSPLLYYTARFAEKVQKFTKRKIYWAMRYGQPSIASALAQISADGHASVLVAPLYPHHAISSTVTAVEEAWLHGTNLGLVLEFLPAFYDSAAYQNALAKAVKKVAASHDYVLFSYHGLPVRHITKADPTGAHCMKVENCCDIRTTHSWGVDPHNTCYRHQVFETTNAVAKLAGVKPGKFGLSFQSRLGRAEWLKPMTSEYIAELPKKGIRKIALIAPAFVADNLETLEEANMQLREIFMAAGGEKFTYIPCLNDDTEWAKGFAQLIGKY